MVPLSVHPKETLTQDHQGTWGHVRGITLPAHGGSVSVPGRMHE